MKILQDVTDLWTMNITFYKEKLNPLSSLMTGATYWCKKQTAIVLVSDRQRNAASQKLSSPMILALYFIHVWTGVRRSLELVQYKFGKKVKGVNCGVKRANLLSFHSFDL